MDHSPFSPPNDENKAARARDRVGGCVTSCLEAWLPGSALSLHLCAYLVFSSLIIVFINVIYMVCAIEIRVSFIEMTQFSLFFLNVFEMSLW